VFLLDWVRYSRGQSAWFQPDDVHLTGAGAQAFADFLTSRLGAAGLLGP
jgi:lysophospholipase L1-like esterase